MKQTLLLTLLLLSFSLQAKEFDAKAALAKSRLLFLENKGQITDKNLQPRKDIDFKVDGGAVTIFVGNGQLHYQWVRTQSQKEKVKNQNAVEVKPEEQQEEIIYTYRMDVTLVGADKNVQPVTEEGAVYTERYYSNKLPEEGLTLSAYKKVTYPNVYHNIDWVLYSNGHELKYDFVVHKGGNVKDIQLRYDGATDLQLTNGALQATTPYGSITEAAPYTYDANTQAAIESQYQLNGNILSFNIAPYESTKLVIDPALDWATYYGGNRQDAVSNVFTDSLGYIYIVGNTTSYNNIATTGSHKDTLTYHITSYNNISYHWEHFIAKFNSAGTRIWSTYVKIGLYAYSYGGWGGYGYGHSGNLSCADKQGNIYLATSTRDTGLATTGAYQDTLTYNIIDSAYHDDGYIVKFNKNGVRQWGTYYGSTDREYINNITTDDNGNIIFSGSHNHWRYHHYGLDSLAEKLVTPGTYQDTNSHDTVYYYHGSGYGYNGYGSFLVKFDGNGNRKWGTFYNWHLSNLTCDRSGNIYAISRVDTHLVNNPHGYYLNKLVGSNAHQDSLAGNTDGLITKFSADGTTRLWATLYGGNNDDVLYDITCDAYNNLYIGGLTNSTTKIATTGTHRATKYGSADAFIVKMDSSGNREWGTYYGGNTFDIISDIEVGTDNQLYVYGVAFSGSHIVTPNAHQTARSYLTDAFLSIFNSNGQLTYGTYFGGTDCENILYPKPMSNPSCIYTWQWWRYGYGYNYAYGHYCGSTSYWGSNYSRGSYGGLALSLNGDIYIGGSTNSDTGFVTQGAHQTFINVNYYHHNYNYAQIDGFLAKFNADTSAFITMPFTDTLLCGGDTIQVNYGVTQTHRSNNVFSVLLSDTSGSFASPTIIGTVNSNVAGTITCVTPTNLPPGTKYRICIAGSAPVDTSEDNGQNIRVSTYPTAFTASASTPICSDDTLFLNAYSTNTATVYTWKGPGSFHTHTKDTAIINAQVNATGMYTIKADHYSCALYDTFNVLVNPSPDTPIVSSNSPICGGDTLKLFAASGPTGVTYAWSGPMGYNSTTGNSIRAHAQPQHSGIYYIDVTYGACTKTDSVQVQVDTAVTLNVFPSPGSDICDGQSVTLVAITQNAGATPQLQWTKNGNNILGANNNSYMATGVQNSDAFALMLTPSTSCNTTISSNVVNMNVSPWLTPSVSITAAPGLQVAPWELVTFTATPVNGGANPTYQWMRNGKEVTGATNATWGTYQLNDGDTISVVLYSDYNCPTIDSAISNQLVVDVLLHIKNINPLKNISLFPNPNNGSFSLQGNVNTTDAIQLTIINSVGQIVHQQEVKTVNGKLNEQVHTSNLAGGVYLLQLQNNEHKQHIRFTVE